MSQLSAFYSHPLMYLQRVLLNLTIFLGIAFGIYLMSAYLQFSQHRATLLEEQTAIQQHYIDNLSQRFTKEAAKLHNIAHSPAFQNYIINDSFDSMALSIELFERSIDTSNIITSITFINHEGQTQILSQLNEDYPNTSYFVSSHIRQIAERAEKLQNNSTAQLHFFYSPTFFSVENENGADEKITQLLYPIQVNNAFYGVLTMDLRSSALLAISEPSTQQHRGTTLTANYRGHVISDNTHHGRRYSDSNTLNLAAIEPALWQKVQQQYSGSLTTDKGTYLFQRMSTEQTSVASPLQIGDWVSVQFISGDALQFSPFGDMITWQTFAICVMGFGLALSLLYAGARVREHSRIQTFEKVQRFNEDSQRIAHLGYWVWQPDGDQMYWSDEMFRILGFKPQLFHPRFSDYIERIHPDDKERFRNEINNALYNTPKIFMHRLQLINGEIKHVCLYTSGQTQYEGERLQVVGGIQGVDELQRELTSHYVTKQRHENIIENMNAAYILTKAIRDPQGRIVDFLFTEVNHRFEEILGTPASQVVNRTLLELFPESHPAWHEIFSNVANSHQPKSLTQFSQPFGRTVDMTAFLAETDMVATFFLDVTEKHANQNQRDEAAVVFESTSDAILICDENKTVVQVNKAYETISGFKADEALGRSCNFLRGHGQDDQFFRNIDTALYEHGCWKGEIWNRRKNGELYPARYAIKTLKDEDDNVTRFIYVFADTSPVKDAEDRLSYVAHHDILTGLSNRLAFASHLEKSLENAKRRKSKTALFFLDIDRFKDINDSLGHAAGDQCLRVIANRINQCVRANDCVARLAGDEFAIVLEDITEIKDLQMLAKKINNAIAEPVTLNNEEMCLTASVGISVYPRDAEGIEDLIQAADTAMYKVKARNPGNFGFYASEVLPIADENKKMETQLLSALNNGELQLFYQPQFNINTGKLRGIEALLRWHHPELGVLMPDAILSIARAAQLIKPLGDWVMDEVCRQVKAWKQAGLPKVHISVNLSLHQFLRNHIIDSLQATLARHEVTLDDFSLEIEITDEILHSNQAVINTLFRLREMGVEIALENFGYTKISLRELKELPITVLKVNTNDVSGFLNADSEADRSFISAVVTTGHALGLKVIATCVETQQQMQELRNLGYDEAQGFLFSHAVSNDDIYGLLQQA